MRIDRDAAADGPAITGFTAAGAYKVADRVVPGGLKLTVDDARDWQAPALEQLSPDDFADLLAGDPLPEFILLGTGAATRQPAPALVRALEAAGVGVEVMSSRAAARAWGVLRADGRRIAAALMPLDA